MFTTRLHNVFDYVGGVFFLLAPFFFGFVSIDPARNTFFLVGSTWLIYSALTDYEFSLLRLFSGKLHGGLDVFIGLLLLTSPQMFDYRDEISVPVYRLHVLGAFAIFFHVALTAAIAWWNYAHREGHFRGTRNA